MTGASRGPGAHAVAPGAGVDASRVIRFADPGDATARPRAFGLPPATHAPFSAGAFVADTRRGGTLNCRLLTLAPHGNGTHTESIAHVTDDGPSIGALPNELFLCAVATLIPLPAATCGDPIATGALASDLVIGARSVASIVGGLGPDVRGLFLRTQTDGAERDWTDTNPPYVTAEAMRLVAATPLVHLICDLPSVDRERDGGALAAHRIWWGLAPATRSAAGARTDRTITELAHLPSRIADGMYACVLGAAPLDTDAAPSRPTLFTLGPP